mmetsp:Transcript_11082/g.26748  ORF Transcript_11082/g.26748 Transcript_11082/m.26748 type:complete len:597 (-) Transcript_11082:36-1826(-)
MDHVFEDLRTSFIDKFNELIETIHLKEDDDSDNDESEVGRKVRAAKSQLSQLKLEGRESQLARRAEAQKISHELWEKKRNLHRLGKKAQRHISLYEYAVLMRDAGPARPIPSTDRTDATERLIGKKGADVEAAATASPAGTAGPSTRQQPQQQPANVTTLILRSQTFYGSSAFLYQMMVQSILQVRLLRKAHLLTMFRAQEAIFKTHKNEEVKKLAAYIKSKDKMDEACIDLMHRKAEIMLQMENIAKENFDLREAYTEITRKQRKIILKLRLKEGQAVSNQVKENIRRRSSLTLTQPIEVPLEVDTNRPFLAELKRESLKRLSTVTERMSQEVDGPMVEKVRMEFSLDEALIKEEEERQVLKKQGRTSPQSHDTSRDTYGMGESSETGEERIDSNRSLSSAILMVEQQQINEDESEHMEACSASYVSASTISDDELDYLPEAVPPGTHPTTTTKKKRTRAELRQSLDRIALDRSSRSLNVNTTGGGDNASVRSTRSTASRTNLEQRRKKAEERLAQSKRMSQRVSIQAKRQKAKQRLEESKRRLQGFLATDEDSSSLDTGTRGDEEQSYQESSTSLKSPDSVAGFPYITPTTPTN